MDRRSEARNAILDLLDDEKEHFLEEAISAVGDKEKAADSSS